MFDESNSWIYREVLERLMTGVYVVDSHRKIAFWSDGAEKISGYLRQDVVGRFCRDNLLEHCDAKSRQLCHCECPLAEVLLDGRPRESRMYLRRRDGLRVPVLVRAVPVRDARGIIVAAAESFDVQTLAPTIGNLPSLARDHVDEATGVPNHWFLLSVLQQRTSAEAGPFRPFGVLRIRIEQYSEMARRYGNTACASLLRLVAESLRTALKPADIVGRWSEAQFAALLEVHSEEALYKIQARLERVLEHVSFVWWGDEVAVKTAIETRVVERGQEKQSLVSWLGVFEQRDPLPLAPTGGGRN